MPVRDIKNGSPFERLRRTAFSNGVSDCGIIPASEIDLSLFERSVSDYPPGLAYLKNRSETRKNVKSWYPETRSILICLYQYWHKSLDYGKLSAGIKDPAGHLKRTGRKIPPFLKTGPLPENPKISRYALSGDYHEILRANLGKILGEIKKEFEGAEGNIFADTSPVLEKELARLAGLGTIGKNTLLLNGELGSYFFIGGIALNLDAGLRDFPAQGDPCRGCDKCVEACPTGALSVKGLAPLKCLSYWTTASKAGAMPPEILKNSRGWIYGCDVCQEACPYNKATRYSIMKELMPIIED
ncbi:MAG: hypothetical protein COT17_02265 [Elusimicrobia bacterium CG08_land_8_20_14_0_20_51_18]|nr:MAG: hypothetical protein COT17_02265 [Elusimicrobia bacterium CG08_land_8_20_14_0_20_51_18]